MLTLVLLSLLLQGAPEGGARNLPPEALNAPPLVDDSPTAWACSVDTLRARRECVFEGEKSGPLEDARAQADANVRMMQGIGSRLCEQVAKASGGQVDAALAKVCERKYAVAVGRACALDAEPVIDGKGRFVRSARGCYVALLVVLQEVDGAASTATACCPCAVRQGCLASGERCYAEVMDRAMNATAQACLAQRCGEACALVTPSRMEPEASPDQGQ